MSCPDQRHVPRVVTSDPTGDVVKCANCGDRLTLDSLHDPCLEVDPHVAGSPTLITYPCGRARVDRAKLFARLGWNGGGV